MKWIRLQRIAGNDECTTGGLAYLGRSFCLTLEPPFRWNESDKSCIPPGRYLCKKGMSPKRGYEVWWINDFPGQNLLAGRTDLQMHKGAIVDHTLGCVLVGEQFEPLSGRQAVYASTHAWEELNAIIGADKEFILDVRHWQV